MKHRLRCGRILCVLITICQFLFVQVAIAQQQLELPGGDISAPNIVHEPAAESISAIEPVVISATVTDDSGVRLVTLFYRSVSTQAYSRATMERVGPSDVFMVSIPADDVVPPGIEYYIQAADLAGNTVLKGFAFSPLRISVTPGPAGEEIAGAEPKPRIEAEEGMSTMTKVLIGLGALLVLGALTGGDDAKQSDPDIVVISAPTP